MDDALLVDLTACETRVWQALVDGDAAADAAALDDGFLGVYPSGFADKAGHVGQLAQGPTIAVFQLSQARVMVLGADHAVLSYRAQFCRPGQVEEAMYVSSIWQSRTGAWVNVFSQDTPVVSEV